MPGTCATRTATPPASTGSVSSSGPTTHATRYVDIGIVGAKCTRTPSVAERLAADLRTVRDREQAVGDHERDVEHRLELGLVEARERPAGVRRLELRGREHPLVARAVDVGAAVVAEQAPAHRRCRTGAPGEPAILDERTLRLNCDPLGGRVDGELPSRSPCRVCVSETSSTSSSLAWSTTVDVGSVTIEIDRDLAREAGRVGVGLDLEVVGDRQDGAVETSAVGHVALRVGERTCPRAVPAHVPSQGAGFPTDKWEVRHMEAPELATAETNDLITEVTQLPVQPGAAMRLLWMLEDPRTSAADLGRLIESDPALSTQVIRLSNTAFYGLVGQGLERVARGHGARARDGAGDRDHRRVRPVLGEGSLGSRRVLGALGHDCGGGCGHRPPGRRAAQRRVQRRACCTTSVPRSCSAVPRVATTR